MLIDGVSVSLSWVSELALLVADLSWMPLSVAVSAVDTVATNADNCLVVRALAFSISLANKPGIKGFRSGMHS